MADGLIAFGAILMRRVAKRLIVRHYTPAIRQIVLASGQEWIGDNHFWNFVWRTLATNSNKLLANIFVIS